MNYKEQLEALERKKAAKIAADKAIADNKLSPEQIKNWRGVLFQTLGAYAFMMPEEQIYAFKRQLENAIENETRET